MSEAFTFIGGGNMAEALLKGILAEAVLTTDAITVCEIDETRREYLKETYGVSVTAELPKATAKADTVMLCVKPQQFPDLLQALRPLLTPDCLVISIAAGVLIDTIEQALNDGVRVVRVMPNTPSLVKQGMSAYSGGTASSHGDLGWTHTILSAVGRAVEVEEEQLHAVTALSGSGPAYIFYWMEAMLNAADAMGVDPEVARILVMQTFSGATALATTSEDSPAVLRANVTSKGGTTAAAISSFDASDLRNAIEQGIRAAETRSRELAAS